VSCDRWQSFIIDRLADELEEDDAIMLEQHLADCAACAGEERRLRLILQCAKEERAAIADGEAECMPDVTQHAAGAAMEERLVAILREQRQAAAREGIARRDAEAAGLGRPPSGERAAGFRSRNPLRILITPVPALAALALVCIAAFGGLWFGKQHAVQTDRRISTETGRLPGEEPTPPRDSQDRLAEARRGTSGTPVVAMPREQRQTAVAFVSAPVDAFALSSAVERDTL
jgi:hypothetical protein